ncbi:MAG: DUF2244 domain-containing protein [Burkholderiales bacterium]|nr:DUF2244 domain-containing protein [Burkholderiales bacterium]
MTASFAPSSWPALAPAVRGAAVASVRAVPLAGMPAAWQWVLRPNCSISPHQLLSVYLSLCIVSLAIAGVCFWLGATYVLGFTGLELLMVGLALVVFARHACDGDTLTLMGASLLVEQRRGARTLRTDFMADWLRVEPAAGQGSLIEISGQGRSVRVGRHLRREHRAEFARQLRAALRRLPPVSEPASAATPAPHRP